MATVRPSEFGWAMQGAIEANVPLEERRTTDVSVRVSEETEVTVSWGSLDPNAADDRVALVEAVRGGACRGMDGTCTVVLLSGGRRERRALSSLVLATLAVEREYTYASSPNASTPVGTLIEAELAPAFNSTVDAVTTTSLAATATVTAAGTPDGSAVDEAFATPAALDSQLSLRLPLATLVMSNPVVLRPPNPPPPPPPPPTPPPAPPPAPGRPDPPASPPYAHAGPRRTAILAVFGVAASVMAVLGLLLGCLSQRLTHPQRHGAKHRATVVPETALPPPAAGVSAGSEGADGEPTPEPANAGGFNGVAASPPPVTATYPISTGVRIAPVRPTLKTYGNAAVLGAGVFASPPPSSRPHAQAPVGPPGRLPPITSPQPIDSAPVARVQEAADHGNSSPARKPPSRIAPTLSPKKPI